MNSLSGASPFSSESIDAASSTPLNSRTTRNNEGKGQSIFELAGLGMLSSRSTCPAEEDMAVTCSKCGGVRFELDSVSSSDPAQQFRILNCSSCGQALGI